MQYSVIVDVKFVLASMEGGIAARNNKALTAGDLLSRCFRGETIISAILAMTPIPTSLPEHFLFHTKR